jgi:hypothetical protein
MITWSFHYAPHAINWGLHPSDGLEMVPSERCSLLMQETQVWLFS